MLRCDCRCGSQEISAASAEARASKILHGLGFSEVMLRRATRDFSGGTPWPEALLVPAYAHGSAQLTRFGGACLLSWHVFAHDVLPSDQDGSCM